MLKKSSLRIAIPDWTYRVICTTTAAAFNSLNKQTINQIKQTNNFFVNPEADMYNLPRRTTFSSFKKPWL